MEVIKADCQTYINDSYEVFENGKLLFSGTHCECLQYLLNS